jgi:two-component system NarL family sensor kinase
VEWLSVVESFPPDWSADARRQVFLFFKETLSNIVRHSRGDKVELSARLKSGWLELEIRDNGRGFQSQLANAEIGLHSLHARAAALQGTVHIDTSANSGTHVLLRVPLPSLKTPLAKAPAHCSH